MIVPHLVAVVILVAAATAAQTSPADWLLEQVKILSAPETEGRASGTPGAERAARHVAKIFERAGLAPGGDGGTYLQSFPVPTGIRLGSGNALTILGAPSRPLRPGHDFTPLTVSADGVEEGELVFAGYGITAPDLQYDDYAGLDVRGKFVLVLSRHPRASDPASPFRRPEAYHYSERGHKIINAREHGARGILLVASPTALGSDLPALGTRRGASPLPRTPGRYLPPEGLRGRSPRPNGGDADTLRTATTQSWSILAAAVTREVGEAVLAATGKRLEELADAIDRTLAPQSFPLPGVRIRLEVSLVRERGTAANVVGVLRGTDPRLRDESIVVGAHYDHLGRGGEGSLAPDQVGAIHPGADDNASGTAAVMGLARTFAAAGGAPRTLVFVAFAGEEMGLLGSTQYVKHPAFPLERTVLMMNLDMVGRLQDGKLYVAGVDSGTGLRGLVTAAGGPDLVLDLRGDPYAPSDHTAFYTAGRPVLFLFTGAHADYHRPSDTWEKLNAPGLEAVTAFASRVLTAVAAQPVAPAYVKIEAPPAPPRGAGYGPSFGVVPEFGESDRPGVRISGVRPGSPAERAGVIAGDLLVTFGGVAVKTLEDFTFALRRRRPGDRVEFTVIREGTEHRLHAILEERRR
jgi:aminopeptidase YwaD